MTNEQISLEEAQALHERANAMYEHATMIVGAGLISRLCAEVCRLRAAVEPRAESVALDYKLPCEVRLPPSMSIGKGCPLSTLMNALRHREGQNVEFMDARSQAIKEAIKFLGDPRETVSISTPGLLQNADTDDAPCTECNGSGWDRLRERECDCVREPNDPQ